MVKLEEYRGKRDFLKTREPSGEGAANGEGRLFVMQKHDASRLHYDLRLELDGVLKSWAVPKGPSYDPADKHLAVEVEDHPLDYGGFEGTIPKGEYGGGTVMLWDRGEWLPLDADPRKALEKGKLKFEIKGEKLKGVWELIRLRKGGDDRKNWLFFKVKDDLARNGGFDIREEKPDSVKTGRTLDAIARGEEDDGKAAKSGPKQKKAAKAAKAPNFRPSEKLRNAPSLEPEFVPPQLATLSERAPEGEAWLHEIKYDGYRIQAISDGKRVRMHTRKGLDWTEKFAPLAEALEKMDLPPFIIDGEACVMDGAGVSDFKSLKDALKHGRKDRLRYYAFDLLMIDGRDLRGLPNIERKELLAALFASPPARIHFCDHIQGNGGDMHREACKKGLEGIICKKADAAYASGRNKNWLKAKCGLRQEFIICGFTEPSGSRKYFGALALGLMKEGKLTYVGKVGTGFDDTALKEVHAKLKRLERKTCPFAEEPPRSEVGEVHWVTPKLLAEIAFTGFIGDGRVRHGAFQGLREDKPPEDIKLEKPVKPPKEKTTSKRKSSKAKKPTASGTAPEAAGVAISHPDRVVFPDAGITKLELAQYHAEMGERILRFMKERPLSLVRCPQGREKTCFFQKHFDAAPPKHIKMTKIKEKTATRSYSYTVDGPGIVSLVQFGAIEFHSWSCRADDTMKPDHFIFDLDPDEGVGWVEILGAAFLLRDELEKLELESWVKLSGGKGLHVYVPCTRRWSYPVVKEFSAAMARRITSKNPGKFIATASKAKRKGKIFVDYLRNGRGATCVVPYGVRARPNGPISTPVRWDELSPDLAPSAYTLKNIARRLSALKDEPWEGFYQSKQSLKKAALDELGVEVAE